MPRDDERSRQDRGTPRDRESHFDPLAYNDFNRGDYVRAGSNPPHEETRSHRGRGPKGWQRADARILEEVCERLTEDDRIDASNVEVQVKDGVVTLSGDVEDRRAKRLAERIADSVGGVVDVENRLRFAPAARRELDEPVATLPPVDPGPR